ncbi:MAG: hypothetical protein WA817_01695 [Candidatus Acidiferrum sp.]
MKLLYAMAACLLVVPSLAAGQSQGASANTTSPANDPVGRPRPPVPAARGLRIEASVGYAYLSLDMPSAGRVNLAGVGAAVMADILPRVGVTADFTYARAANVFDTQRHADILSYLTGPVFYPIRTGRLTALVHGLIGGARVTGPVLTSDNTYLSGYTNRFSWAMGGGVRFQVTPSVALQVSSDYLRTGYFNPNAAVRGQNNVRVVCGVVYSFWKRSTDD